MTVAGPARYTVCSRWRNIVVGNAPGPVTQPEPRYEFPRLPLARFVLSVALAQRRSFAKDSQRVLDANPNPRRVEGLDNVPAKGPFVLAMNHYNREGLRPYHCAMMISAALAERRPGQPEIRWAFASELYGKHLGPVPIPVPLIRWVFRRFARIYNLVVMPRRDELVVGRAAALRRLAKALADAPVGLTPEAAGSGKLMEPPKGTGLFFALLARCGYPVLPVAVWEDDRTLVVRFGEAFRLALAEGLPRNEQDRLAREQVMTAIGRLLPRTYWGAYEASIERTLRSEPA